MCDKKNSESNSKIMRAATPTKDPGGKAVSSSLVSKGRTTGQVSVGQDDLPSASMVGLPSQTALWVGPLQRPGVGVTLATQCAWSTQYQPKRAILKL